MVLFFFLRVGKCYLSMPCFALGCRLGTFSNVFVIAPPKIVTFESGIAYLGENRMIRMYSGTRIPPPPIPPPAATINPMTASASPRMSRRFRGSRGL